MARTDETYLKMTTNPVGPLILSLAIPAIISMLVTNIYNTADTYFVSQLGDSASGAIGIIFSIMAVIQAIGFTIGMGSGSILSRLIGAKDYKNADVYSISGLVLAFSLGTIVSVLGISFLDTIITKLGATPTILPYAREYARWILLGTPFMATSFTMNNQLRFQGKANLGTIGLATGGILNIGLDPLFIFVFNWGIAGAALATLCSQLISFSILLSMFLRKKTITNFSFSNLATSAKVYLDIFTTGLPSFFRQGMGSFAMIILNRQAGFYGGQNSELLDLFAQSNPEAAAEQLANFAADASIAGMAISTRVMMLVLSIAIGLGQGYQPVCAMNYGAKLYDRVKKSLYFLAEITALAMTICAITIVIFAPEIAHFFRDTPAVIEVAKISLRSQAIVLPFAAIIFGANMTLQTTGRKKTASFTSLMRQGFFFIPLLYILPPLSGITGVECAQGIADLLTAFASLPFIYNFLRELK